MRHPGLPECFVAYIAVSAARMSCSDVRRSPRATTTPMLAVTDAVAAETVKGWATASTIGICQGG
jgi:hypothetical protein